MNAKTDGFLNLLLWSTEAMLQPGFRNLTGSYESWAYRNGLRQRLTRMERQQLVERDSSLPDDRLYRLTDQGRLRALGGRDPERQWARAWDGRWRLVLFDVPKARDTQRERLRRYLRQAGFGYLQNSVWITPDPVSNERKVFGDGQIHVETLVLLEARPCAGESDAQIVEGAWDFQRINRRYRDYLKVAGKRPTAPLRTERAAGSLLDWATTERRAWMAAVTLDPLLPEALLPAEYLGKEAWRQRVAVLREAARGVRDFAELGE